MITVNLEVAKKGSKLIVVISHCCQSSRMTIKPIMEEGTLKGKTEKRNTFTFSNFQVNGLIVNTIGEG